MEPLPTSIKAVIALLGFMLLSMVVMQGFSLVDFERAVALGLQEDSPTSPDRLVRGRALLEQGTAAADLLIQGPLFVGALVGLWRRRTWGLGCAFGALAISVYWPTFDFLQESFLVANGMMEHLEADLVAFEAAWVALSLAAAFVLHRHRRRFTH